MLQSEYPTAPQQTEHTMTETVAIARPPVAKPVSRPRSKRVSASALALHLDCSRTYIGKLEAEGVIQWQGDGFPLDQSRVAHLRYLRREHRRSPRAEADAAHVAVKTEMLKLRLMEKRHELVRRSDVDALIDDLWRCYPDRIVEPACAVRAPGRSCDPAQHRAGRVRSAHRDSQRLPGDGRQVR